MKFHAKDPKSQNITAGYHTTGVQISRRHHARSKLFYSPRSAQRGYAATKNRDGSFTAKVAKYTKFKGKSMIIISKFFVLFVSSFENLAGGGGLRSISDRQKLHFLSEFLESADMVTNTLLRIELIKVVNTQILVGPVIAEHEIDRPDYRSLECLEFFCDKTRNV